MADRLVINSGPLVALARADALRVIGELPLEYVCPVQVRRELDQGKALGHPAVDVTWLQVAPLAAPLSPVILAALDEGEAAVIQLALEQRLVFVCLDDLKGRRTALAAGLKVTGSLGLLARAKRLGIIPAVRPVVEKVLAAGAWYDPVLVRRFLAELGE